MYAVGSQFFELFLGLIENCKFSLGSSNYLKFLKRLRVKPLKPLFRIQVHWLRIILIQISIRNFYKKNLKTRNLVKIEKIFHRRTPQILSWTHKQHCYSTGDSFCSPNSFSHGFLLFLLGPFCLYQSRYGSLAPLNADPLRICIRDMHCMKNSTINTLLCWSLHPSLEVGKICQGEQWT